MDAHVNLFAPDIRVSRALRKQRVRGFVTLNEQGKVEARFKTEALREQAPSPF